MQDDEISRTRYSEQHKRGSLGLGAMGYHSYLQKTYDNLNNLNRINKEIFSWMRSETDAQTLINGK